MSEKLSVHIIELPAYLDVSAIVKNFSICEDIVWEAIHAGELKASKPGRIFRKAGQPDKVIRGKKYIVRTSDVVAWFARWEVPFKTKGERHESINRSNGHGSAGLSCI